MPVDFRPLNSDAFDEADLRDDWIMEGILARNLPTVIGGPSKSYKTTIAIELAISVSTGSSFLAFGRCPQPQRVAFLSGENAMSDLRRIARKLCASRYKSLGDCDIIWSGVLPLLSSSADRKSLCTFLRNRGIKVVIIDSIDQCLFSPGRPPSVLGCPVVAPIINAATRACLRAGATPIFVSSLPEDLPSNNAEPKDLCVPGLGSIARQWILLGRPNLGANKLKPKMTMTLGGNSGHVGRWSLEFNELRDRDYRIDIERLDALDSDEDEEPTPTFNRPRRKGQR